MSTERERARRLADEVRAAVAETSPESAPRRKGESSSPEERAAEAAASRAADHVMPSIPSSARLSRVKRGVLRALRFLWRDQSSFNALSLQALDGLRRALSREREERRHDGEEAQAARERMETALASADRRAAIQDGRLAILEGSGGPAGGIVAGTAGGPVRAEAPALPPGVYSLFEERFRGPAEEVAKKQRFYLPFLAGLPGPVLDVGCGRGEFLNLLRREGIRASGFEVNPIAVRDCLAGGLDVAEGDGVAALRLAPAASLGAVTAFQVVEHWSPETLFAFLREARRVLAPGGLLALETINTDSLSAWRAFYLDPSHVRPVPPEALKFLAESAGFVDARLEYLAPLPPEARLEETTENDARLNRLLFGPQDYALLARAPGPAA